MSQLKTNIYKNKKIVQRLCITFISTIFLGFFLFIYGQFQTAALQTITSFNGEFVTQVNTISSALRNNISSSAMQMFYTSSIKNLRTKGNLSNAEKIVGLRDLGNFVGSSDFLNSIMVYNSKSDMIFTSEGKHASASSQSFHDTGAVEILTHPEDYPYLTPIKRNTPSGTTYSFLFFEYQNSTPSSLLVNIDDYWYTTQLLGMSDDSDYIIADEDGTIIASADEALSHYLSDSWSEIHQRMKEDSSEGFFMPSSFSRTPGWMFYHMENSDWFFLKPIRLDTAAPGLVHIRNFLFLAFILMGGLFLIFTTYLLLKVYFPFHDIRQETKNLQYLAQLHSGELPPGYSYPVVYVETGSHDHAGLHDIIAALTPTAVIVSTETGVIAALCSCTKETLPRLISKLSIDYTDQFYLSDFCYTQADLIEHHAALEELRKLQFLYPDRQMMTEDILRDCNTVSGLNHKEVSALITALKSGQPDTAFQHWELILAAIQKDRYSDFYFALRYLSKQLNQLRAEVNRPEATLDIDGLLETITGLSDLNLYMRQLFDKLATAAAQKKLQQLSAFSVQIEEFIRLHYREDSFSPQQVAEHFNMNAAYLSRQYQQTTGLSISDAIHKIRIHHACRLLTTTDDSIESIAQSVGYSNIKYFFVLFKKWTDYTPNQYRLKDRP